MTIDLECYAIRQKSTGYFLPMRWGRSRGHSYDIPTAGAFPRLFKSHRAAKCALSAWLQGEWKEEFYYASCDGPSESAGPMPTRVDGRHKDGMEIVKLILVDGVTEEDTITLPLNVKKR